MKNKEELTKQILANLGKIIDEAIDKSIEALQNFEKETERKTEETSSFNIGSKTSSEMQEKIDHPMIPCALSNVQAEIRAIGAPSMPVEEKKISRR